MTQPPPTRLVDDPEVVRYLASGPFTFEGGFRNNLAPSYCEMHNHPFFEIVMHAENRGTVHLQTGQRLPFEAGGLVIHPPVIPHSQQTDVQGADLCVLVGGPPQTPDRLNQLLYVSGGRHPWLATDIKTLIEASRKRSALMDRAHDHRAAALFLHLLDAVDEPHAAADITPAVDLVREAERIVSRDYGTLSSIGELAERLCVSASYLRHVYKQQTGGGLKRRLIQVRLDHACDLLVGSTLPIKTISAVCGFENDRYFSTCFKTEMGCVAGEYRRRWSR